MALSKLAPSDAAAYSTGQFSAPPKKTPDGTPDPNANVDLGGWSGTDTMYFKVTDVENTESAVAIDVHGVNTLNVTVSRVRRSGNKVSYYSVNTGTDTRSSQWDLVFAVYTDDPADAQYTGKWKFTKGTMTDDTHV